MGSSNPNSSVISVVNDTLASLQTEILTKLQHWGKTVQLTIDEIDYYIDFSRELPLVLKEGSLDDFDFKLTSSSDIFFQIIRNELNPVEAVVSGEVAIEGNLTDALEFSEYMSQE